MQYAPGIRIYLDGVEQHWVADFDENEGWIIKYADPVVVLNDRAIHHKLFGRVEVIADNLESTTKVVHG